MVKGKYRPIVGESGTVGSNATTVSGTADLVTAFLTARFVGAFLVDDVLVVVTFRCAFLKIAMVGFISTAQVIWRPVRGARQSLHSVVHHDPMVTYEEHFCNPLQDVFQKKYFPKNFLTKDLLLASGRKFCLHVHRVCMADRDLRTYEELHLSSKI